MKFTPKSEKQINEANLLPDKTKASFEVLESEDQQSKSGNEMIKMKVAIFLNGEQKTVLFDYLLEAMAFKLRHFCQNTGLIEKYENGELTAADCMGKIGDCIIGIQKDKTGAYPDKNVIKDYIESTQTEDIPF